MAQKTVDDVLAFINEGGADACTPIDGKREKKREKKRRKGKRKDERGEENKPGQGSSPAECGSGPKEDGRFEKIETSKQEEKIALAC